MAFNNILGNTIWKTSRSDSKIFDLAIGSESDRFTQILDLLTTNKEYYLQNGLSENQWTSRYNRFKCDDDILSLATGSASDRFDQIIELLKTNKNIIWMKILLKINGLIEFYILHIKGVLMLVVILLL